MGSKSVNPVIKRYGLWQNAGGVESVFKNESAPSYPFIADRKLYWLESLADEGGRVSVVTRCSDGSGEVLTPDGFDIRSRVHEYGGKCFCVHGNRLVFNNYGDGCLYTQSLNSKNPPEILPGSMERRGCRGFADLIISANGGWVIAVAEIESEDGENKNSLTAVSLQANVCPGLFVLAEGEDFYANPALSADDTQLAWMEWSHPYMPWDQTRLIKAELEVNDSSISIRERTIIVNEENRAVCQVGFVSDGRLAFVSDGGANDYWNLFLEDRGIISQITGMNAELGEPHWVFGQKRWQQINGGTIAALSTDHEGDRIVQIDFETGECTAVTEKFAACRQLHFDRESATLCLIAGRRDRKAEILQLKMDGISAVSDSGCSNAMDLEDHSVPMGITFKNKNEQWVYGYFYSPKNSGFKAPPDTLPPLMVVIHGGPTSRATAEYSPIKQYFCSLGFALLDINHHGSSGCGRAYRQQLLDNWGVLDADDIVSGINFVVDRGWVDGEKIFIRGSSAGGYAVLRALTRYPHKFAAGACYYGIGNLAALSAITHKFESRYTDNLIGEKFDPETSANPDSRYVSRSPIFHLDSVNSPIIFFQGKKDKVVPPGVTRGVIAALKKKGIPYEYTEYAEEGHGFRHTKNKVDALTKEVNFFAKIITDSKK